MDVIVLAKWLSIHICIPQHIHNSILLYGLWDKLDFPHSVLWHNVHYPNLFVLGLLQQRVEGPFTHLGSSVPCILPGGQLNSRP
jgi:hypothetical protein